MIRGAVLAVVITALGSGCVYHLRVESRPVGALMTMDEETYVLPTDLHVKWRPFKAHEVEITAPGYRPLAFKLKRRHIHETDFVTDVLINPGESFGKKPRRMLEVRLVPDHGPSGTWSESDVNR